MAYWENADYSWTSDSLRYINTPSQKSRELFYYVQEIGRFKANKPYFTERANLPSYLMKFTRSGSGSLIYQQREYTLRAGDVFFIDCRNYQYYQTESEEPWVMDWVHFDGGNTAAFYEEFLKSGTNVFHTEASPEENPVHLIMNQLLKLQEKQTAKTDFTTSTLLHELLNELLLQKFQLNFEDTEIPAYISDLKDDLEKNFKQALTLDELARKYHRNKYQLNKEFSRFVGSPPIDFQISKKISYAKDLLRYSDLTIQQVAGTVGMDNAAYFSRLFKLRTGLTPSHYRKIGT